MKYKYHSCNEGPSIKNLFLYLWDSLQCYRNSHSHNRNFFSTIMGIASLLMTYFPRKIIQFPFPDGEAIHHCTRRIFQWQQYDGNVRHYGYCVQQNRHLVQLSIINATPSHNVTVKNNNEHLYHLQICRKTTEHSQNWFV